MAFRFPLAAVLRMRTVIEEREEAALQRILFEIAAIVTDLEHIEAQRKHAEVQRHSQAEEPCLGLDMQALYGEIKYLHDRRKQREAQLDNLKRARDAQLLVYQSARRDRELLSNMRAELHAAWQARANRREQSTLDDNFNARRDRLR